MCCVCPLDSPFSLALFATVPLISLCFRHSVHFLLPFGFGWSLMVQGKIAIKNSCWVPHPTPTPRAMKIGRHHRHSRFRFHATPPFKCTTVLYSLATGSADPSLEKSLFSALSSFVSPPIFLPLLATSLSLVLCVTEKKRFCLFLSLSLASYFSPHAPFPYYP